ncbi:MAG: CapA family protein [Patescibacteria group bacterium]
MQILLKILVVFVCGAALGTSAMSFVIGSPASADFQAVTIEDLRVRREMNDRLLSAVDGAALPLAGSRVTLLAVGDVMLSRVVAERMRTHGPDYPFSQLHTELSSVHITFGNLETPIAVGSEVGSLDMSFRADPWAATALQTAGFDVVSLANNHVLNRGTAGLVETIRRLDEVGIAHTGAGETSAVARTAAIIERAGLKVVFLAYTYDARNSDSRTNPLDLKSLSEDIAAVRQAADVVVVSMHAGIEYAPAPNRQQIEFAHAAIDAGADVVLGHHPHVVQTAEIYNGKYIFYSLGNFVFDQMWSRETRLGLGVRLTLTEHGVESVSYWPIVIDDFSQPRAANEIEANDIIERLGEL